MLEMCTEIAEMRAEVAASSAGREEATRFSEQAEGQAPPTPSLTLPLTPTLALTFTLSPHPKPHPYPHPHPISTGGRAAA